MGLFKHKDKHLIKLRFQVAQRFGSFRHDEPCNMMLYDDYLKIESVDNSKIAKLKYEQVIDVRCGSELYENDASAVGRTVAGGLLFGGVGAIAGAASALKGKTRKTTLAIDYKSSNGNNGSIAFTDPDQQSCFCESAAELLRKLCKITDETNSPNQEFL